MAFYWYNPDRNCHKIPLLCSPLLEVKLSPPASAVAVIVLSFGVECIYQFRSFPRVLQAGLSSWIWWISLLMHGRIKIKWHCENINDIVDFIEPLWGGSDAPRTYPFAPSSACLLPSEICRAPQIPLFSPSHAPYSLTFLSPCSLLPSLITSMLPAP